jgi:hypothetical protein
MSNQKPYVFSEAARSALIDAEVHLSDDSLKEIFQVTFNAIHKDVDPDTIADPEYQEVARADLAAASRCLQVLADGPNVSTILRTGTDDNIFEAVSVRVPGEAVNPTDGKVYADVYSKVVEAARQDLTGFILEALQLHSREPITIGEADIISKYIDECRKVVGIDNV